MAAALQHHGAAQRTRPSAVTNGARHTSIQAGGATGDGSKSSPDLLLSIPRYIVARSLIAGDVSTPWIASLPGSWFLARSASGRRMMVFSGAAAGPSSGGLKNVRIERKSRTAADTRGRGFSGHGSDTERRSPGAVAGRWWQVIDMMREIWLRGNATTYTELESLPVHRGRRSPTQKRVPLKIGIPIASPPSLWFELGGSNNASTGLLRRTI